MDASSRPRILVVLSVAVVSALGVAALAFVAPAQPSGGGDRLLPDLITLKAQDIYLQRDPPTLRLRFDNTVANRGKGPLEIFPEEGPAAECNPGGAPEEGRFADQRVFFDNPDGDSDGYFEREDDSASVSSRVGCMRFHPQHDHWHLDDFARYELRSEPRGRLVGVSTKVGFCVWDGRQPAGLAELPGHPRYSYYPVDPSNPGPTGCTSTTTNGLSIGFADIYTAGTQGQAINITGIRRGRYCLIAEADPENRLEELNNQNNSRQSLLRIRPGKDRVVPLPGRC
jgi:Lysyl oxidase